MRFSSLKPSEVIQRQTNIENGKTIILIQGNWTKLFFTRRLLLKNKFRVISTGCIEQASVIAQNIAIDILITEVNRRSETTFSIVRKIRKGEIEGFGKDILIIGFSGKLHKDIFLKSRNAGLDMFFYKPFSPELMLDFIIKVFKLKNNTSA